MKYRIRKCPKCGRYTLKEKCPICGAETISPHPARFSPEDKYVEYRVKALYSESGKSGETGSSSDRESNATSTDAKT
ncbi:ribosome biogenesis protein [Desulfurococcaceae archaeon AG1]|jgi:H/ACA ribonucleoprotein complex subunit 3|nr:MAG: ribosome biogenesis protein [Desulfurococcaceae archaeon]GAY25838.1 ribosome biogenesis protein [Desulfurococcaceae archaeon AG1]